MKEINLIIAKNLKGFRESKKLSLERVSELTGVSKTMIGQIERGESSPTITTIWKIANGLKISFTSLINDPQPDTKVISKDEIQILSEDNGKYRVYPYFPFEDDRRFEVYSIEIEEGGSVEANLHREGTEEFITVFEGELTISINSNEYIIKRGNAISFRADRPHSYYNRGKTLTRLSMIIYYPV
ncbi:helix-turn-helix domain-containing protein (plasmid) [Priestia megaterium]|jgi:XRE family transcriptional regulator, regulator of sulfur utilization|uniref:Helix-turn-helix family protein n=1 Tax=Priestia megaterium (strain ATCC 14581 / DSM 32 / CCUG 1817 / JCM 2506 / NBRC 15308 / NCIMB 9376 / NCTC 10342 / NRRL B-14308 / VKM B-512 / Ford 19) TaxID=1348623 RepID=A0A0B6B0R8_PRIM2|nr:MULTISPECIES: helix-turn-helix domain-containing protein [Priestia]AJI25769.1 helix-turn-helix family protein [Priestia megaterium NBRC 15308 = ATCC 14581]KFM95513.1 helix-turn-helix family protein [Priestia megaterium]KGJ74425.1 DNA-binding protein [Priestia megaterium NBRC 15308 = ATCC 14581]KNH25889.1 DNA-binding protein [Priestia megaterium]MBU8756894.1 helix-turn-helix domain-containing protein [Priestia megaterium]